MTTTYEVYGINKETGGTRHTKITYNDPVEIYINGKLVHSNFPQSPTTTKAVQ